MPRGPPRAARRGGADACHVVVSGLSRIRYAADRCHRRGTPRWSRRRGRCRINQPQPSQSTTCCCAAVTSSIRETRLAPCATSRLPAARSRRSATGLNPADALKTVDVSGLYVTPGLIDIHTHVYAGTGEPRFLRRRQQRLSRWLHVSRRRDDRRRRRQLRLAELRRLQDARHRSIEDACPRLPQHRRQRHARREVRAGSRRHGGEAHRRHGAPASRADCRDQDRALHRPRVGAGRARGRGRHAGQRPGDGRLRLEPAGAAARRARDEEASARRHLHARVLRAARRAGPVRSRQPGACSKAGSAA